MKRYLLLIVSLLIPVFFYLGCSEEVRPNDKPIYSEELKEFLPRGTTFDTWLIDRKATFGQVLIELSAKVKRGKLVDGKGREIKFMTLCWGGKVPSKAEAQKKREDYRNELNALRKNCTVIEYGCPFKRL